LLINISEFIYFTPSWTGHVARMGERKGAYRVLMGKPEGRKLLGIPRRI
jgi:hypothetical protein